MGHEANQQKLKQKCDTGTRSLFLYLLMDAEQKTKYKFICIAIHWKWSTSSSAPKDKWAKNCRRSISSTVCLGYYTSNAIKKEQIHQPTKWMAAMAIEALRAREIRERKSSKNRCTCLKSAAKGCIKSAYLMHLPFKAVNASELNGKGAGDGWW